MRFCLYSGSMHHREPFPILCGGEREKHKHESQSNLSKFLLSYVIGKLYCSSVQNLKPPSLIENDSQSLQNAPSANPPRNTHHARQSTICSLSQIAGLMIYSGSKIRAILARLARRDQGGNENPTTCITLTSGSTPAESEK